MKNAEMTTVEHVAFVCLFVIVVVVAVTVVDLTLSHRHDLVHGHKRGSNNIRYGGVKRRTIGAGGKGIGLRFDGSAVHRTP